MQTKADVLTALPRPAAAANGEFPKAGAVSDKKRPGVAGWDPYEVWLTRVKAIQEPPAGKSGRGG
jgi:hypothetical protein